MKKTPREFQARAFGEVRERFRRGMRRIVLVSPTGSGKTFMAGMVIEGAIAKGNHVLFLAHRRELIDQCSGMLDELGIDHGVIKSGHWRMRPTLPVQVASVQTLAAKIKCPTCRGIELPVELPPCAECGGDGEVSRPYPRADIVIVDECHRCLAKTYQDIMERYPNALVLGLTATPWRLDGRGLGAVYEDLVGTLQIEELIKLGHLLPIHVYSVDPKDLRLEAVKPGRFDYESSQLATAMRRDELIGDIVQEWFEHGEQRQTVIFASSTEHSQDIVRRFNEAGVKSEHLDGKTPDRQREAILARLASGQTRIVSNVDVLVEGYDLPSLGCVVLARPTKSLTRYLQMVGRVMRPSEGMSYAILLDHAACVDHHYLPTHHRRWSLEDRQRDDPEYDGAPTALVKCEKCGALRSESQEWCASCSSRQVLMFKGLPTEREGKLIRVRSVFSCEHCRSQNVRVVPLRELELEVKCRDCSKTTYEVDRVAARQASSEARRREFERLDQTRKLKRLREGWTAHAFKRIFGEFPPNDWTTAR
jgi:DNA repair protein RadD